MPVWTHQPYQIYGKKPCFFLPFPKGSELFNLLGAPIIKSIGAKGNNFFLLYLSTFQICSEPFTNVHDLILHASSCNQTGERGFICCYCGQSFPSAVALSLHQIVWSSASENKSQSMLENIKCPLKCCEDLFSLENLKVFQNELRINQNNTISHMGFTVLRCFSFLFFLAFPRLFNKEAEENYYLNLFSSLLCNWVYISFNCYLEN